MIEFVTVIIPVYGWRTEQLGRCLEALQRQSWPKDRLEVIVVDNGSEEDLENLVSEFSQTHLEYEPHPGSYAARNLGIGLARGEVIAFTDSDCIPSSDWIEQGVGHLKAEMNCGLVAGRIKTLFQDSENPTAVELYESLTAFQQEKFVEKYNFGATANLFIPQEIMDRIGLFDDELKSLADLEWGSRAEAMGIRLIYGPLACVDHYARNSLRDLWEKSARTTGGYWNLLRKRKHPLRQLLGYGCLGLVDPRYIIGLKSSPQVKSLSHRLKLGLILMFVLIVRGIEMIRLILGGESKK